MTGRHPTAHTRPEKIRRQKSQDPAGACDVSALPAQAADAIRAHDPARAAAHPVPELGTAAAARAPDLPQEDAAAAGDLPDPDRAAAHPGHGSAGQGAGSAPRKTKLLPKISRTRTSRAPQRRRPPTRAPPHPAAAVVTHPPA